MPRCARPRPGRDASTSSRTSARTSSKPFRQPPGRRHLRATATRGGGATADEPKIADDVVTSAHHPAAADMAAASPPPASTPSLACTRRAPCPQAAFAACWLGLTGLAAAAQTVLSMERGRRLSGCRQRSVSGRHWPHHPRAAAATGADPVLEARLEDANRRLAALSQATASAAQRHSVPSTRPGSRVRTRAAPTTPAAGAGTAPRPQPGARTWHRPRRSRPIPSPSHPPHRGSATTQAQSPGETTADATPSAVAASRACRRRSISARNGAADPRCPQAVRSPRPRILAVVLGSYANEADAEQRRPRSSA